MGLISQGISHWNPQRSTVVLFLSLTLPLYENVHYMASAYENLLIIGKSNLWSGEDPDREAGRLVMAGMALLAEVFLKKLSFYLFFFFFLQTAERFQRHCMREPFDKYQYAKISQ